ncbi:(deoxy)nucleoside triphosphate pyrophosphohydrolase [Paenibacillus thailandensis]|uniref:(deoxy)nucleoside triphosphate pyrophosphohydrolase n=1 Tax=Paenibacillus thailandensis TaxID=393250 RepID=UPI0036307CA2
MGKFPGGKIEAGESPEECLRRELAEEMDIDIRPYAYFGTSDYSYDTLSVRLIAYKAAYAGGTIRLTDHDAYRWVQAAELSEFDFAPADKPFVDKLPALVEVYSNTRGISNNKNKQ